MAAGTMGGKLVGLTCACGKGSAMGFEDSPTSRLVRIMGEEGVARLTASKVVVLGLGGVGSSCAEALVRGGVGHVVLVDHDVVQPSNLNRQALAFTSTIGQKKAQVMAAMARAINPQVEAIPVEEFVLAENVPVFMDQWAADADYVVDAIDTISAKLALAEYACAHGTPLISSMGAANKLHPTCLREADLFQTVNCPLCRIMRKEGRKRGIDHLKVVYSCEQPVPVAVEEGATRRERTNLGTASYMPPIMGQMVAGAVLRELAGLEGTGAACSADGVDAAGDDCGVGDSSRGGA